MNFTHRVVSLGGVTVGLMLALLNMLRRRK